MDIKKENLIRKKMDRVFLTAKEFLARKGEVTDEELANIINSMGKKTSSSTVGRDLTENLEECYRFCNKDLTFEQKETIIYIKEKRKENKLKGKQTGGMNYASNNEALKDEMGRFKGSRKRG